MKLVPRVAWVISLLGVSAMAACGPSGSGDSDAGGTGGVDGGKVVDAAQVDGSSGDGSVNAADSGPTVDAGPLPDASQADDRVIPPGGDAGCTGGPPAMGINHHICAPNVANECDGTTDSFLTANGVVAGLLNGTAGNGFDDDCDGIVDEGCGCPGNGMTKDCYLIPATQANQTTKLPVGWCASNSKGSVDCVGTEFAKWSGTCRGAQPPYPDDSCGLGDFNCDGVDQNSVTQDCMCQVATVNCPTTTVTEAPYPTPTAIQVIDGSQWIANAAQRPNATNWTWTVIGGDCDNVLPHPTYAIYNGTNSTTAARQGTRQTVRLDMATNRYVVDAASKLAAIRGTTGAGVAGGQVYPAFGLSGDYVVQGEFDLGGMHYACTQKVAVRAPGIRAELCWDTVGGAGASNAGNDIDLHFARMQLASGQSCTGNKNGWDTTCKAGATYQDCWYSSSSGCRDYSSVPPGWGYGNSLNPACIGWSSKRAAPGASGQGCTNPRLDKDNVTCDSTLDDPTNANFCGPENINLDNPNDNDSFVVGVTHFGTHGGSAAAKTHVNMYCNGARVISVGYNPVTSAAFPVLNKAGADTSGDFWTVGTIKAHVSGGNLTSCDVATIPSHFADPGRDGPGVGTGGNNVCVDSTANMSTPVYNYVNHQFVDHTALQGVPNMSIPTTPAQWCKH